MKSPVRFPVLPAACLIALAGCSPDSTDVSLLEQQVEELRSRCEKADRLAGEIRRDLRTLRERQEETSASLDNLKKSQAAVRSEVATVSETFGQYRSTYRDWIRSRVKGMTFPALEMEGRSFFNVVVRELNDAEMTFQHRDGISRVDSQKLPGEMRELFVIGDHRASEVAEVAPMQLAPLPPFLGLEPQVVVPAPLMVPQQAAASGAAAVCPTNEATPQPVGRVPTGYRPVGSSFQGSYYKHNKTTVGFPGTRQ